MHIIFCVSGYSGVGKDEFTSVLKSEFGAIQTGLVDPAKRHMADIYGFSRQQLFGPSSQRNGGDVRYPKPRFYQEKCEPVHQGSYRNESGETILEGNPDYWLSPREALQKYCELMNTLFGDTWVRKAFEVHGLLGSGSHGYDPMVGLVEKQNVTNGNVITVMADFRHWHEVLAAKRITGARVVLIRIKSDRVPLPPFPHRSETEQATIPDSEFDYVVMNNGTIENLHSEARRIYNLVR